MDHVRFRVTDPEYDGYVDFYMKNNGFNWVSEGASRSIALGGMKSLSTWIQYWVGLAQIGGPIITEIYVL